MWLELFPTLLLLFVSDYFIGFVIWLVLLIVLIIAYNLFKTNSLNIPKTKAFYISATAWLLVSSYFSVVGMRGGFTGTTRPITLGNAGVYTQKPLEMAIVLNTPFSIAKTLDKRPLKGKSYFSKDSLDKIYNPVHIVNADSSKAFKPMNVVVLIMESFAKEYIGAYNKNLDNGTYEGYTPFLDSLISESMCFQYSFANGRKSIDALPSVVASIPSIANPYVTSIYAGNKINSLASLLKTKGYQTAFFHGAPNGSMGFDAFMKLAGYDKYFGMTEYDNDDDFDGSWGIWDEEFLQFMADELNGFEEPFQATFFSLSSHHPFKIPERYEGMFKKGTLNFHIPIQYSDMALRKFFDKVSKTSWFENTLFVITADHSNNAWHPEYKTFIGGFCIPIIFYNFDNGQLKGMDSSRVAQQMDIMPTILDYLNYDQNFFAFGNNLFDDNSAKFAVSYNNSTYQLIQGEFVLYFVGDEVVGLYNYVNDPLLEHDLKGTISDVEDDMLKKLKAFIQQYNNRMISNSLTTTP